MHKPFKRRDVSASLRCTHEGLGFRPARAVLCLPGRDAACVAEAKRIGLYDPVETEIFACESDPAERPLVASALRELGFERFRLVPFPFEQVNFTGLEGRFDVVHLDLLGHPNMEMAFWARQRLPRLLAPVSRVILTTSARRGSRGNPLAQVFLNSHRLDAVLGRKGGASSCWANAAALLRSPGFRNCLESSTAPAPVEERDLPAAALSMTAFNAVFAEALPPYADEGRFRMMTLLMSPEGLLGEETEISNPLSLLWPSLDGLYRACNLISPDAVKRRTDSSFRQVELLPVSNLDRFVPSSLDETRAAIIASAAEQLLRAIGKPVTPIESDVARKARLLVADEYVDKNRLLL